MKKLLLILALLLPLPAAASHTPLELGLEYYDWAIVCSEEDLHEFVENMRAFDGSLVNIMGPFVDSSKCDIQIFTWKADQYICSFEGGDLKMSVVRMEEYILIVNFDGTVECR